MNLFGQPNIKKMAEENDYTGLHRALEHRSPLVRLEAAQALAEKNDGTGWRMLLEAVQDGSRPEAQEFAAAALSELGSRSDSFARRVAPALGEALKRARGETAETLRDALEAIGGPEAEAALRQAGFEPAPTAEVDELTDFEAHFVRPSLPQVEGLNLINAEQHLNNAVQLHEAEIAERGLVETSLALWLKPDWAYAWYLRGVLFEDLERPFEAVLSYHRALELDPRLEDAVEALDDLRDEGIALPGELELDPDGVDASLESGPSGGRHSLRSRFLRAALDVLAADLTSRAWQARRDAAAAIGVLAEEEPRAGQPYLDPLIDLLVDSEREVRHAAIQAMGRLNEPRALQALLDQRESSWLLRFSIIEAISNLGSVDSLVLALRREMNRIQERNPVFSSQRDPLVEVEYGALMEIGVRALERTGDLEGLLALAEDNVWVEVDEEADEGLGEPADMDSDEYDAQDEDEADEEEAADEDLMSYVDEAAQMAAIALERLALAALAAGGPNPLPRDLLERMAQVPDLTLIDLTQEETGPDAETSVVHDFSAVRTAARAALQDK